MKNSKPISAKEISKPTTGGMTNIDEMAKLWIELVLSHIQKRQSFSLKRVHTINYRTI